MNSSRNPCKFSSLSLELAKFKLSDVTFAGLLAVCIINGVLSFLAVSTNVLVVATILKYRELRSNSNILTLFLALIDLMVGLIVQPSFIVFIAAKLQMHFNCAALMSYMFAEIFCVGLSLLTLSVVTFERYIAIFHPFWYVSNVSKPKLLCVTGTVWVAWTIFNIVCRALRVKNDEFFAPFGSSVIGLALVLNIILYFKIFEVIRHHKRQIRNLQVAKASVNAQKLGEGESSQSSQGQRVKTNEHETRMTRTVGYILGTLILCYSPLLLTSIIEMVTTKDDIFDHFIYPLAETIVFMNSALNPFLYCLRCHDIRKRMLTTVYRAMPSRIRSFAVHE